MYKRRTKSKKVKKKCSGTSTHIALFQFSFVVSVQRDEYVKIKEYLKQLS